MTFSSSPTLVMGASSMVAHMINPIIDLPSNSFSTPTTLVVESIYRTLNLRQHHSSTTLSGLTPLSSMLPGIATDGITSLDSDDDSTIDVNVKSLRKQLGLNHASPASLDGSASIKRPKIVGHRGALYDYLENTREGFVKCAEEYKCDAVELDVFILPKCGTVVVFHGSGDDATPGELSDYIIGENKQSPRSIMDLSYEEVLQLRFNPNFDEFPCPTRCIVDQALAYVPTLEHVLLDLKGSGCKVKIELKGPGVVKPVLDLVEKLQMEEQCSYSSFNFDMLQELRTLRPDKTRYPTGALFEAEPPFDFVKRAIDVGATEVHLKYDVCTISAVEQIHEAGLGSMAWLRGPVGMKEDTADKYLDIGNEDEACYQALIDTGVQQICCNKPNVLLSMLANE